MVRPGTPNEAVGGVREPEMVERVAEAIWRQDFANYEREPPCDWAALKRTSREDWHSLRDQARAAITAMREPTEAMEDAADEPFHAALKTSKERSLRLYGKVAHGSVEFSRPIYAAMIDAALGQAAADTTDRQPEPRDAPENPNPTKA